MSDDATVVAYLQVSQVMCNMTRETVQQSELHSIAISAWYIPGKKNILPGQLSCPDQVLPTDGPFFLRCSTWFTRSSIALMKICLLPERTQNYIFTSLRFRIPWKQDSFQHPWDGLTAYTSTHFALHRHVLSRVLLSARLSLVLNSPYWPQEDWFADLLALLVAGPLWLPLLWNLLVQSHIRKFHRVLGMLRLHAWKLSSDVSERLAFHT